MCAQVNDDKTFYEKQHKKKKNSLWKAISAFHSETILICVILSHTM